jgi:hypothetical protein
MKPPTLSPLLLLCSFPSLVSGLSSTASPPAPSNLVDLRGLRGSAKEAGVKAESKCCEAECPSGEGKYYSVVTFPFASCGESCFAPEDFDKYKRFEPNMEAADTLHPCLDRGYGEYRKTETHGKIIGVPITVDLYGQSAESKCCEDECPAGEGKYYSVVTFPAKQCGESCFAPEDFDKYKRFEPNMEAADTLHPCLDRGYHTYLETETHGKLVGLPITVDLYGI